MKIVSVKYAFVLALIVGGCSHYSDDLAALDQNMGMQTAYATTAPQEVMPSAGGQEPFGQMLARNYYQLARHENDMAYDYKASKLFTQRAKQAAAGKAVAPLRLEAFDLPSRAVPDLMSARENLMVALQQNAGNPQPVLAKAQTSFDCWVERAEEARSDAHYAECKGVFEESMAQLVAPAAGEEAADKQPPVIEFGFGYNSTVIQPEVAEGLDEIAKFLSSDKLDGYDVMITGYIPEQDTSGYGKQLATSRALVINQALRQRGVSKDILKPQITVASAFSITPEVITFGRETVTDVRDLPHVVHLHAVARDIPKMVPKGETEAEADQKEVSEP